ncbi:NEDD8-conjugating enzyme Ubc12-like isoform X2 [Oryza brachyantha]|uniref:NEDD8-conjugating enzyme Ubc12-like isoform X2 n=1 Tax=Oryza brachyantha TaxID=4533 RepID=UPI001ADACFBC|nr:NEDD8-conjugating enzyme Ubc12-like isoform X2 [Oryza brachyantha]XP_040381711.1 NEDD8-conjugating enzyme Ubc12-like isoform X2 [Oryza brachyantha]
MLVAIKLVEEQMDKMQDNSIKPDSPICIDEHLTHISELNLPKSTSISFPNGKDDLMNFEIIVRPDEGYYLGGTFVFTFQVSPSYPHEPPKVKCKTKASLDCTSLGHLKGDCFFDSTKSAFIRQWDHICHLFALLFH